MHTLFSPRIQRRLVSSATKSGSESAGWRFESYSLCVHAMFQLSNSTCLRMGNATPGRFCLLTCWANMEAANLVRKSISGTISLLIRRVIVNHSSRIIAFLWCRRGRLASLRHLGGFLCIFFLAGLATGRARDAYAQNTPIVSVEPGLPIAVADLDGDLLPDLVEIRTGRNNVSVTDYWVQLQLSAAGPQSIRVVAPPGGLQIVARDVNGDHVPDLILTTTWLRRPVAILLNDGHGSYSRVDPTAFPEAFGETNTNWRSSVHQVRNAVGVSPRTRLCLAILRLPHLASRASTIPSSNCGFFLHPILISSLGRAPPSKVPQL